MILAKPSRGISNVDCTRMITILECPFVLKSCRLPLTLARRNDQQEIEKKIHSHADRATLLDLLLFGLGEHTRVVVSALILVAVSNGHSTPGVISLAAASL